MIITASDLILDSNGLEGADNPVIGYQNLATIANTSASEAPISASFPLTNLLNTATNLEWRSANANAQYITSIINTVQLVDYVAIARHNLGTSGASVQVEGYTALDGGGAPIWTVLLATSLLATNEPAILRFTPGSYIGIRLRIGPVATAPRIGVFFVGKLLICPRPIYEGHSPITLSRQVRGATARSESGNFLGRVTVGEGTANAISLENIPKAFYRTYFKPFVEYAGANPFFFAWRPQEFPREVGYLWLTGDPKPVNGRTEGFMSVEFPVAGIST